MQVFKFIVLVIKNYYNYFQVHQPIRKLFANKETKNERVFRAFL